MRLKKALIIFRKDWLEVRRNWQVILPLLILPVIFAVVLPLGMGQAFKTASGNQTEALIKGFPQNVQAETAGMTGGQISAYIALVYLFAPFFLLIPLMASSVIASDSFAGEKERKTTEALLATPITDGELFLGKILVSFIPAMIVAAVSFTIYAGIVNATFLPIAGRLVIPNATWVVMMLALVPALTLAGIGIAVIISSKVKGFKEAQQITSMMVIPVLLLFFGQISGILFLGPGLLAVLAVVFFLLDIAILRIGVKLFHREELLSKMN